MSGFISYSNHANFPDLDYSQSECAVRPKGLYVMCDLGNYVSVIHERKLNVVCDEARLREARFTEK